MSRRIVYKYHFGGGPGEMVTHLEVPFGKVVHIATQKPEDPVPTVWIEHNEWELEIEDKMQLYLIGTGRWFDIESFRHLGSCVCADGSLVWHVYCPIKVDR